jgi:hypothetical protein
MKALAALLALVALAASPAHAQSYNPNYGPWGNVVFPPFAQQDYWRAVCYWYPERCAPPPYVRRKQRSARHRRY